MFCLTDYVRYNKEVVEIRYVEVLFHAFHCQ